MYALYNSIYDTIYDTKFALTCMQGLTGVKRQNVNDRTNHIKIG